MGQAQSYVIIGNGIAGVTAAEILRAEDASCAITMIADDPFPAYYRPALKDYLGGGLEEGKLWARPKTFYAEQRVRFVPGRVIGIDTAQRLALLQNGKRVGYDRLLLANGARPRALKCPGLELEGVSTLRTVADYREILRRLRHVRRVVVSGSGTLALESAETLRHRGYEVTHLLRGQTLWSEVLDPVASDLVLEEERRDDIDVRTGEEIAEIVGRNGQVSQVVTTHGERITCELVLIAIGIEPLTDFIRASGIACGRGVQVDSGMRTSVPDIYAAGDVIETSDPHTGKTRVLGQWFPAIQQAQVAARNMLGLLPPGHPFSPAAQSEAAPAYMNFYNATLLYGLDFVSVGLTTRPHAPGYTEIVADPLPRSYRKVILKNGTIVGVLLLGNRKRALAFKRAIDARVNVMPVARQLFDDTFDLDAWLDARRAPAALLTISEHGNAGEGIGTRAMMDVPSLTGEEFMAHFLTGNVDGVLVPLPHPSVEVEQREAPIPRREQAMTIGRQVGVAIQLEHRSISRLHAEIACAGGAFTLRDLGSSNGTHVNGRLLRREEQYRLRNHDRVRFGDVQFRFELRARPDSSGRSPLLVNKEAVTVGVAHRRRVEALSEERVRFEIDMCIGCNRCMDACPVPMSSLVTIADLNTANVSDVVAPQVARFTHECIMCGSCVPVCPVDNHRDLLMLALKERLGVSWKHRPDIRHIQQIVAQLPAGWTLPLLMSRLRDQAILRDTEQAPDTYLLHILAASTPQIVMPGEALIREGEYGRDLHLILDGGLELRATGMDGGALPLAIARRGEYVGEDGMLTGLPYKATAMAQAPTLVLSVPEQVIQRLMELAPGVHSHFERYNSSRSLQAILKRMALFQGVADADIQALMRKTPVKQCERGERLFAEDERAGQGRPARETLHILLEGFVKVARHTAQGTGQHKSDERIIAYRQGGDYFAGGLDLLGDGQAVTVTAINRCRVAEVPRAALLRVFEQYPEVSQRFTMRLHEYVETAVSAQGYTLASGSLARFAPSGRAVDAEVQDGLHALVSDGVVEGTGVLVIDLDKCIHCDECEDACARRHGHSRMNRKGMVVGNISIATACRQCQDPVCMLCSRAGIARHPNGEVYITESCIGCGICAERCPYGAISIVNIDDEPAGRLSLDRFRAFFTNGTGRASSSKTGRTLPVVSAELVGSYTAPGPLDVHAPRSAYDELRKKVAIKCDLCAGYGDQACVQACPTGAAVRISPVQFFGSTEEILRRRAR
jgi:NADPH-dependent 2,4-dienoyl-CoA reductase/sulfur reductase-like enzyme/Fe-S-cluster-containing hydrogenase component 2/CRP-like cAMP-binding protein